LLYDWLAPFFRWQLPYAGESHVRFCDDAYVVGKFFSLVCFFSPKNWFHFIAAVTILLLVKDGKGRGINVFPQEKIVVFTQKSSFTAL
jgi:hypothetical protein